MRHKGGGHKRLWREVDFSYNKIDIPAKIVSVEYDPNRTAFIGLAIYSDGEKRYVIITPVVIGDKRWDIEVTLTKRDELAYRMLLGRQAMVGKVVVDPAKSFRKGKVTKKEARLLYKQK